MGIKPEQIKLMNECLLTMAIPSSRVIWWVTHNLNGFYFKGGFDFFTKQDKEFSTVCDKKNQKKVFFLSNLEEGKQWTFFPLSIKLW